MYFDVSRQICICWLLFVLNFCLESMDDYFKKLEKLFKNQLDVIKEIEIKVDSLASQKLGSSIPHSPEHLVISTPVSWSVKK